MDTFINLPEAEHRLLFEQAQARLNLPAASIPTGRNASASEKASAAWVSVQCRCAFSGSLNTLNEYAAP